MFIILLCRMHNNRILLACMFLCCKTFNAPSEITLRQELYVNGKCLFIKKRTKVSPSDGSYKNDYILETTIPFETEQKKN